MPRRTRQTKNESVGRSRLRGTTNTAANRTARPAGTTLTTARRTTKGTTSSPTR